MERCPDNQGDSHFSVFLREGEGERERREWKGQEGGGRKRERENIKFNISKFPEPQASPTPDPGNAGGRPPALVAATAANRGSWSISMTQAGWEEGCPSQPSPDTAPGTQTMLSTQSTWALVNGMEWGLRG